MPLRRIPGTDLEYFLVVHDEAGRERPEADGKFLSDTVEQRVSSSEVPITDVFFTSHGWKGDVPAAIEQYDKWIAAMAGVSADRDAVAARSPGFKALIVGLHWPSLPWGDESVEAAGGGVLGANDDVEQQVEAFARRIADTPTARGAIRTIVKEARARPASSKLSPAAEKAYAALFAESGLATGDAGARPGADQEGFDPAAIIADYEAGNAQGATQLLGFTETVRDAILSPLRQISFWKMKDRARIFGEAGGNRLLRRLQDVAPRARFHLMGHSFGCIVVSATVAGVNSRPLPRPVDSLFLVQGALSLWAYAKDIPYARGTPGYFYRVLSSRLVRGPIVTTRSKFDTAVGRFYPMGARIKQQLVLGNEKYPEYGGIGTFGIQGTPEQEDLAMGKVTYAYAFRPSRIYNLEASDFIKEGDGASGAHSDIAHPEVAHAFWAAVLAGMEGPPEFLGAERESPSAATPASDAFAAEWGATRSAPRQAQRARPPDPGLLGASPAAAAPAAAAPRPSSPGSPAAAPSTSAKPPKDKFIARAKPPPVMEQRWVNLEVEGQAPDQPLVSNKWYALAVDVDVELRPGSAAGAAFSGEEAFAEGETEITLTVQLDTADFETSDRERPFRLARTGRALTRARFDIRPLHDGPSTLKATIHKQGNFIQQIDVTFDVGAARAAPVQSVSRGRAIAAADMVKPRDIGLSISPSVGGYDCIVWGAVMTRAKLPLQPAYLASAIDAARDEVMKVVMYKDANGDYSFQKAIAIPDADRDAALKILARAGAQLFHKLFFGPAAADDSKRVGKFLRDMASRREGRLQLQIVSESTPVPWGLLYVGDASEGATLDWDNFIGMRHVIEQIPLQTSMSVSDSLIRSDNPKLSVSVNVNSTIDAQMHAHFVSDQQSYWADRARSGLNLRLVNRTRSSEFKRALASTTTDDQILYLYCHAEAAGLNDPGGPDASSLVLSDARVTLGDLNLDAPTDTQLRGNPLVFINACESAQMSPAFYDGFVPYFMAKGARGVVGTECQTPALFAAEWAERFFERFLGGEALGELFLGLRQDFLNQYGNPLGLMYAVHCDGDTQIQPGL